VLVFIRGMQTNVYKDWIETWLFICIFLVLLVKILDNVHENGVEYAMLKYWTENGYFNMTQKYLN
jgi:hypothetical protein